MKTKEDLRVEKWNWMMDFCKKRGYSPAEQVFWNEAEKEFNKRDQNNKDCKNI